MDVISFPVNLLLHGIISLPGTTSYDKFRFKAVKLIFILKDENSSKTSFLEGRELNLATKIFQGQYQSINQLRSKPGPTICLD